MISIEAIIIVIVIEAIIVTERKQKLFFLTIIKPNNFQKMYTDLSVVPIYNVPIQHNCKFPSQLYNMLEGNWFPDIVSWSIDGRSFKIHNEAAFTQDVMPRFFTGRQKTSFFK